MALEKIRVEFLRSKREVISLIEPLPGVHAKSHLPSARIDPRTAAEIRFDCRERRECVGFEVEWSARRIGQSRFEFEADQLLEAARALRRFGWMTSTCQRNRVDLAIATGSENSVRCRPHMKKTDRSSGRTAPVVDPQVGTERRELVKYSPNVVTTLQLCHLFTNLLTLTSVSIDVLEYLSTGQSIRIG